MPSASISRSATCCWNAPVLGWLDRNNFERARRAYCYFSAWSDHRDFVAERDALYLGYGTAGLTARYHRVTFSSFERWSRLTGAPIDLDGLDAFAAHRRWRALNPKAPTIGRFGVPDNPERHEPAVEGAQLLLIQAELFETWRDSFAASGMFASPDLNVYAAYVTELCLLPAGCTSWPPSCSS